MNNKDIIRSYEQICSSLKSDKSEENKQRYLILFKELEIQLSRSFEEKMELLSYTARSLKEEIKRVDSIISLFTYRREFRARMIRDHKNYIGYEPLELEPLEVLSHEDDYRQYRDNLITADRIITGLIKSGKRLKTLNASLERNPRNKNVINSEIKEIQDARTKDLESLKNDKEVLEDLYNYCLTAPFNEENAYIEYIMIKMNPRSELKINLNKDNKRAVRSKKSGEEIKPVDEMPTTASIGSVKPNSIVNALNESKKEMSDINIPSNGILEDTQIIKIDTSKL